MWRSASLIILNSTDEAMSRNFLQKAKPYYIRKALRYLRHYGVKDFAVRVRERLTPDEVPYGPWFERHKASECQLQAQREESARLAAQGSVKFSIVIPVFRTPERFLRPCISSVLGQTYPNLELILANASPEDMDVCRILSEYAKRDVRVNVIELEKNEGIAGNTNAALFQAEGTYVCFMDHDDMIAPDALYETVSALERTGCRAGMIYTDEDKIRDDAAGGLEHFQPHFKPDFNLDLLRSNNYICHFLMVSRDLISECGGIDGTYEGAQDYEFILRLVDLMWGKGKQDAILHIPKVLYHWRVHEASTADNPDSKAYAYEAGRRALMQHLERRSQRGSVSLSKDHGFYRVRYEFSGTPSVSVIIPNCGQKRMLERCLSALKAHTDYENIEIIVVENNSSSREIFEYYKQIQGRDHVKVVRWKSGEDGFSFSKVCNYGVMKSSGEYLVFLNNDVEVRDGWLQEFLGVCQREETGACGAKLYYPDGKIQSAGIVVGIGKVAGSLFSGMNGSFGGYLHRASTMQDLSAVTAAFMMVKRSAFEEAGGFTQELAVAFNDVDLCLKMREKGYLIVYDPFVEATHYESASRGDEYTKEKAERFRAEEAYMKKRWAPLYEAGDPYYNPNLSLARWDYTLKK